MAGQRNSYGKRSHSHSDYENGSSKRRNSGEDRDHFVIDSRDTVYRYLCPINKIGSIIGRGGDIVKQLRIDTKSKIRISDALPGCEERVVTIYSASDETNEYGDGDGYICPAQDALFRVHEKVIAEDLHDDEDDPEGARHVIAKLLVPSDQIGCIIGKGGQIVQSIRNETGAQIRILKDEHLPGCALSTDELVQISGEAPIVKKALFQIASRLHDNPSRSQHLLVSSVPTVYAGGALIGPTGAAPIVGIAPLMGAYGGYKGETGDWSRSLYSAPKDDLSPREFSIRMVCPTANVGFVIGKGGTIINQIRQDSGAIIKVDSTTEGEDCLITISAKEVFDDHHSPAMEAALRLQPRCSEQVERDSGLISYTTRLLVPTSRIGCLLGKGGAIINEMRRATKANIRILGRDNLPKVAAKDDEMVQICGDLDIVKEALAQISRRLRANVFDREGAMSTFLPVLPYVPVSNEVSEGLSYDSRDSRRHGRGHSSYSGGYGSGDYAAGDSYAGYGSSQISSSGGAYGSFGSYSSGRSSGSGLSGQNPVSRRKSYY